MKKIKLPGRRRSAVASSAPLPKGPKVITARRLFWQAWRDFISNWKPYLKILAIVAVPVNALGLISVFAADPLANSYASFAAIVMNLALLSAIIAKRRTGQMPGIATAYYEGTAPIVRYILVTVALVIMLLPAAIGIALCALGLSLADIVGVYGPEQILIMAASLLLASPSLFLLVRFGLAPVILLYDDLRPIAALRQSWAVTRRRYWITAARFIVLGLGLLVVSLPATLMTFALNLLSLGNIPSAFFELAATLTALPLANLYLIDLYRDLAAKPDTVEATPLA